MKKLIALALAALVAFSLVACGADQSDGTAAVPDSSDDLKGEHYEDVLTRLEVAGFTNVETSAIDDLIVGWLTKDGEVEEVSINGDTDFFANARFPADAIVVVRYHTFPEREPETVEGATPAETESLDESQEPDNAEATPDDSDDSVVIPNRIGMTVPEYEAFAEKYAGRTIEFDGFIRDLSEQPGASPKTLYDAEILVGDYWNSEGFQQGPTFRVEGLSSTALDYRDVHVVALVDGYETVHESILLTLISIDKRIGAPMP